MAFRMAKVVVLLSMWSLAAAGAFGCEENVGYDEHGARGAPVTASGGSGAAARPGPGADPASAARTAAAGETAAGGAPSGEAATLARAASELDDASMLELIVLVNRAEVEQGTLAKDKANDPDVKAFAERMVAEHGAATKKTLDLAKTLAVKPNETPTTTKVGTDGAAALGQLKATETGQAFDRAYMTVQVKEHEKVLAALDAMKPRAGAPAIAALIGEQRGHVLHHLEDARRILRGLGEGS